MVANMEAPEVAAAEEYVPITSVRHVIVHTLLKEQKDTSGTIDPRPEEMEVTGLAQRLVDTLYVEYRKRHSKSHGKFDGDEEKSPSQVYARRYLIDREIDFYEFSTAMAKLLCDKTERTAATGGHIFIAHVDHDGIEYVLIALITEEQAIALSERKDLEPAEYLNLKGFRFAGRIDVSAWSTGEDRYVSFLKGTKNVADYFKAFLACDTAISNLLDTQHLTESVRKFALSVEVDGQPLSDVQRDTLLRKVDSECRRMADDSIPLNIEEFSRAMWPSDPDALANAITQSGFEINDGFVPHKSGLRGLVSFRGKGAHWTLEFDRRALLNREIIYNDSDQSITLKGVPRDLIEKLKEEEEEESVDE
jgi:nucleoid-associated protein